MYWGKWRFNNVSVLTMIKVYGERKVEGNSTIYIAFHRSKGLHVTASSNGKLAEFSQTRILL